ncbi:MAG TPA: hypothetical protein VGA70_01070 [Longimicrobiales bacterium]
MESQSRGTIGWTLASAGLLGALFLGVSAIRAGASGVPLGDVAGPILALGLIGATVGGLIGPLLGAVAARMRNR